MERNGGWSGPGAGDSGDRLALRDLVEAYALTADRRDADGFAGLFLADATLSVRRGDGEPTVYAGPAELAEIPRRLARYQHTYHDVGHHRCQIDGDVATGEAGCRAHHLRHDGDHVTDLVLTIRYTDRYARTADGWRFAERQVHILWTSEEPATAG